jgi:hypothetical protein
VFDGRGASEALMMHRYQSLALYRGRAYVPTMGKTPMGLLREIEPVAVLEPTREGLVSVLADRLVRKPAEVPEWFRGDKPLKNAVQAAAKSRSWIGFARGSLRFALIEADNLWQVSVAEGPSPDDVEKVSLPRASGPGTLTETVLEVASRRGGWL